MPELNSSFLSPESVATRKVGEGMGLLDRDAFQWMELLGGPFRG